MGRRSRSGAGATGAGGGVGAAQPVGFANYERLVADPVFHTALVNNVIWVVGFGGLVIGLLRHRRRVAGLLLDARPFALNLPAQCPYPSRR